MQYSVIIGPEAEEEIHYAFDWYESQQEGLGLEFLEELNSTFTSVAQSPESRTVVYDDARLALIKRFPYVVCYLMEDCSIYVLAVFHGHRDPDSWKHRLR